MIIYNLYVLVVICVVSTFKIQERRKEHWWETCKFEMYKKQNNHQWLTPSFVTQWYSSPIQKSSKCHRLKSHEMHSYGAGRQSVPRHGARSTSCFASSDLDLTCTTSARVGEVRLRYCSIYIKAHPFSLWLDLVRCIIDPENLECLICCQILNVAFMNVLSPEFWPEISRFIGAQ